MARFNWLLLRPQAYVWLDLVEAKPAIQGDSFNDEREHQDEPKLANSTPDFASTSASGPHSLEDTQVSRLSADADTPQRSADVSVDEPDLENAADDKVSQSSSAMDESMGSEEDNADHSPREESPMDLEDSPIESSAPATELEVIGPESASQDSDVQFPGGEEVEEPVKSNGREASQEPSVASDAYEPPEPSIGSNSPYSPPFSPAPPEAAQATDVEQHSGVAIQDVEHLATSDQREMDIPEETAKVGLPV